MPLFDFLCGNCGKTTEILIFGSEDILKCNNCGSQNLKKLVSAHSPYFGNSKHNLPGPRDTACCGSAPGEAAGCAGPGSCCGKHF